MNIFTFTYDESRIASKHIILNRITHYSQDQWGVYIHFTGSAKGEPDLILRGDSADKFIKEMGMKRSELGE